MLRLAPILAAATFALTSPVWSQETAPVGVLADRMFVDATNGDLRAEGNVTITQGATTLQTELLIYDSTNGTITVPGALRLIDGDENTVFIADFAELDTTLQAGVIEGARALIDGELQIAAGSAQRIGERYTVLNQIVASSCTICERGETPIWQLRATRAVRDAQEQRLHYENATLSMLGLPVLYLPYFSHPDSSVERATGFLSPEFFSSSIYGTGVKLPYFIAIAPDRDVTITPFVTTGDGLILEGQYRQAFDRGRLQLDGSVRPSGDGNWRGYATARGSWGFENGVVGSFSVTGISDDRYLADYGYSAPDRILSNVSLAYSEIDHFWTAEALYYDTLRAGEAQTTVPFLFPDAEYRRAFDFGPMQAEVSGSILSFSRQAGRDVTRASVGAEIDRTLITGIGLVMRAFAETNADLYVTQDDPTFGSDTQLRMRNLAGLEFRYPFILRNTAGAQILEPIVQIVHADDTGDTTRIANEDSTLVEFDETNLFTTNRFAGADRFETGTYANVGLRYEARTRSGMILSSTVGRVYRDGTNSGFAANEPLGGNDSDYVLSFGLRSPTGWSGTGSILANEEFDIERNEIGVGYASEGVNLAVTYASLEQTPTDPARAQLIAAIGYEIDENWRGEIDFRRDMEVDQFISAGGRLQWENECIRLAFSMSRNFAQSNNIADETSFGLNIELVGVGAGRAAQRHRERCEPTPGG